MNTKVHNTSAKRRILFSAAEILLLRKTLDTVSNLLDTAPTVSDQITISEVRKKLLRAMLELDLIALDPEGAGTGASVANIGASDAQITAFHDSRLDQLQAIVAAGRDLTAEENMELMSLMGFA